MEQLPVMDPDKSYEWMVIDSRHVTRTGRMVNVVKSACVTEDITISEDFWLDENGKCFALDNRTQQLNGNKPAQSGYPFIKGFHFFAKVFPIVTNVRNGRREYIFNCDSFTTSEQNLATSTTHVNRATMTSERKWILAMCEQTLTQEARHAKCKQMGSAYLKEYRKLMEEKLI